MAAAVVCVAVAVLLRFWTRSALWLDEVQTLDIARLPVEKIPSALRIDGAPPLYYLILHGWIRLLGSSDAAVRALPGLFGVCAIPLAWVTARSLGGRRTASAAALLTATSPFALWYSTDNRMYSLVIVEVLVGFLAVDACLNRIRPWVLAGLGLDVAALLYTHYWSLFLVAVLAVALVVTAVRLPERRRSALACLGAVTAGSATFLAWMPTFLFQLRHTGTPWITPAGLSIVPDTLRQFSGGATDQGICLEAILAALVFLGVFGRSLDGRRTELDFRGRRPVSGIALASAAVLGLAILGGKVAGTGFQDRYAAVVFPGVVLVAGAGAAAIGSAVLRRCLLGAACFAGLFSASYNVTAQRTEAVRVAAVIRDQARPGDVVAFCPDQLSPDAQRLLPVALTEMAFPRTPRRGIVDWVDYRAVLAKAEPSSFAADVLAAAGPRHTVWYVWNGSYRGFSVDCRRIADDLLGSRPDSVRLVNPQFPRFSETSRLTAFRPLR